VLEEWYLNPEKRDEQRARLMAHSDRIEARDLVPPLREGYRDLGSYLDARIATERAWAEKVAPDLGEINRRRALLERHWRELIAEVRGIYHGPVGYAANFDQYREVGFWDALDVMGINAYFQLRRHLIPDAAPEDLAPLLAEGWRRVLEGIQTFRQTQGLGDQPVMFTELGFTHRANSTIEPWAADGFSLIPVASLADALAEETGEPAEAPAAEPPTLVVWQDQPEDRSERALAVRALHQALKELQAPFLEGILYWKLSSHPWHWDDEPFVLLIDEEADDPLLAELQRFVW